MRSAGCRRRTPLRRRLDLEAASFKLAMVALAGAGLLLLVLPTVVVLTVSFTSGFSLKFPPPGYSLKWYAALLDAWQLQFAAGNSLEVAIGTTAVAGPLAGVAVPARRPYRHAADPHVAGSRGQARRHDRRRLGGDDRRYAGAHDADGARRRTVAPAALISSPVNFRGTARSPRA